MSRFTQDEREVLTRLLRRNDRRADSLRRRLKLTRHPKTRDQLAAAYRDTNADSLALRRMLETEDPPEGGSSGSLSTGG